jgi:RNA polymerase sigma factor (sigma-70 family)
VYSE